MHPVDMHIVLEVDFSKKPRQPPRDFLEKPTEMNS